MDAESVAVKTTAAQAPAKKGSGRNSEKRRERSKVAARCRRSKESEIFSELAEFLPLPESTRNALDKASVMRLSLSDLKLRHMMDRVFLDNGQQLVPQGNEEGLTELEAEVVSMVNNAMGGFLLVMSTDGDIIYASDSIATHLGLSQVEVMGLSIYDFSHPCDQGDIKELLTVSKKDGKEQEEGTTRSSSFRMKCTITARGRNVHLRAASYKVIDFTGRMFSGMEKDPEAHWFVGIGEPLFHPSDVDIPLNKQTFLTKHSPDLKCEFVDDSIMTFLGYQPDDLIGKSIFDFHHAADGPALAKAFKSLYTKGQSVTERYRFLAKHGGWIWVITQATLIQPNNGSKPNSIVCLNFVTSGVENEGEIMSAVQEERSAFTPFKMVLPEVKSTPLVVSKPEGGCVVKKMCEKENILPEIIPDSKPIMSTKTVIAPRTEDMDSGFLMPCDDTLIVSKEEPDDLTHLAPIAGDACVPLDMPIPLLDTLLKEMEEANVPFTFNENCVEVNFDDVPQLEMPMLSSPVGSDVEQDRREICCGGVQSPRIPMSAPSPLFLNSDPPMVASPGSGSSLLSPFQLSPNPARAYRTNSDACGSTVSGSSYEFQPSPNSLSGYEDSAGGSPPALIGLNLQDDTFQSALLMESQLDDPGPAGTGNTFGGKPTELGFPQPSSPGGGYAGAFVTLADGRKFPVIPTTNPVQFMWAAESSLNPSACDAIAKKSSLPILSDVKIDGFSRGGGLCDLMEVEQKDAVVTEQTIIQAPSNDTFDPVLKGPGGPLVWNWNSPAPVHKLDSSPAAVDVPKAVIYKDSSSGPPLAKQARLSPALVNKGRDMAGSSLPILDYPPYASALGSKPELSANLSTPPDLPAPSRKIPVRNASLPPALITKMPENVECMDDDAESSIANLGIDLRTCLQKLLSNGKADKVKEIVRLLRESNATSDEEDQVDKKRPEAGKLIADDGGGHSFGMRRVQNYNVATSGSPQQDKVTLPSNRRRYVHGGLLSTLGTTRVGLNNHALPGLFELTRQDCEVNAPLNESSCLLSGADLLTALENDTVDDPFA